MAQASRGSNQKFIGNLPRMCGGAASRTRLTEMGRRTRTNSSAGVSCSAPKTARFHTKGRGLSLRPVTCVDRPSFYSFPQLLFETLPLVRAPSSDRLSMTRAKQAICPVALRLFSPLVLLCERPPF